MLIGTVPPFLLKAADNPEGVDGQAFEATAGRLPALVADLGLVSFEGGPHNICWTHREEVDEAPLEFLAA
ncbi:hypothetical protein [Streptomyces mirabilis]|uniref:hypothetical protein n=1 Tax=Streptomyces mirabilis TaxID=68239 RepID=UPI0033FC94B2